MIDEPTSVEDIWRDDLVGFLIGCSFTFEHALMDQGIPVRNIDEGVNVPMYATNQACVPAGQFTGSLVVSMRPLIPSHAIKATEITARLPRAHGAPVHFGDPSLIGIKDIGVPDFGDAVTLKDGEVPVFWACGVTPQLAIANAKPEMAITHAPGYMFVSDMNDSELVH